jgi:NAD(P)-dependent dehydrogenase (short-subunit alcohol dehydrogenase family)
MTDNAHIVDLTGKVAFVVGGCGLVGKAITKAMSGTGAKTVILDVDSLTGEREASDLRDQNLDVLFSELDCSKLDKLENRFSNITDLTGCPDIFVNCAYPRTEDYGQSSFSEVTLDSFRKNVDMQLNSSAWLARLAAENMVKKKILGSIVQLGSIYGVVGQDVSAYVGTEVTENMTYSIIKGGIVNLTRQMASYYGRYGIRVNTICPGALEGHVPGIADKMSKELKDNLSKKIPLGRLGSAYEVASVALFLASDLASYITGATIMVDGGWTAI